MKMFRGTISRTWPFTKVHGEGIVKDSLKLESKCLADDVMVRIEKELLRMRDIIPREGFLLEEGLFIGLCCSVISGSIPRPPLDLICVVCQTLLASHNKC